MVTPIIPNVPEEFKDIKTLFVIDPLLDINESKLKLVARMGIPVVTTHPTKEQIDDCKFIAFVNSFTDQSAKNKAILDEFKVCYNEIDPTLIVNFPEPEKETNHA